MTDGEWAAAACGALLIAIPSFMYGTFIGKTREQYKRARQLTAIRGIVHNNDKESDMGLGIFSGLYGDTERDDGYPFEEPCAIIAFQAIVGITCGEVCADEAMVDINIRNSTANAMYHDNPTPADIAQFVNCMNCGAAITDA